MLKQKDLIFISIDCWRHDAVAEMPQLTEIASNWESGSVICASPQTGGAFPAIFCSTYHPNLYTDDRTIREDITSLPQLLATNGYSTAGFAASNPNVSRWADHFDYFWNAGLELSVSGREASEESRSSIRKAVDHLTFQSHTDAEYVLRGADAWWEAQSSPRFLWVHLMEPHSPYLPGLQRGVRAGLLKSYASLLADAKHPDRMNYRGNVPEWIQRHLQTLYEETVRKLDSTLSDWVAAHEDDATILMTGDHGEEFDHGLLTHSRLYDETVKVPLLTNRKIGSLTVGSSTRQIDLSPTLIDTLDLSQPSEWEGTPAEDTMPPQPMIGSLSRHDRFWLGVRSERWKYIKNYQREIGVTETEAYDVLDDPNETESLAESELPNELPELLNSFMERPSIQDEISQNRGFVGNVDSTVEARLKELGYTG